MITRRLKSLLLAFSLLTCLQTPLWAMVAGDWQGSIQFPGEVLQVSVHLQQGAKGEWSGTIDIPAQKAKGLPLTQIKLEGQQLSFQISGVPGNPTFKGQLSDQEHTLSGKFEQAGQSFDFSLSQPPAENQAQSESDTRAAKEKFKQELRELIENNRKTWKTPGLAVAVIKEGELLFAEGFGLRDQAAKLPVTAETLFAIGSSTKAFTAASLAMLVEQDKLDWDQPVQPLLPGFELRDTFASQQMTVRDLLTHRSGLPRHDLTWYDSSQSRQELFQGLKYLEPTASFRNRFQYQNLMYMSAGLLLEKLSGQSWENFVEKQIFGPLGMQRSSTHLEQRLRDPDYSLGYQLVKEQPKLIPARNIDAIGPAGSINSSIQDMAKWLAFQLGDGKLADKQLLQRSSLDEMHAPQMVVASSGTAESPYMLYGLGWFIQPYRGHTLIQHGGNIDGFTAMVALLPEKQSGLVILSNLNGDPLPTLLMNSINDRLLGLEPINWNARFKGRVPTDETRVKPQELPQVKGTQPSHPLSAYVGTYHHPAYGSQQILLEKGQLVVRYRHLGGPLKHWHYDQFRLDQPESTLNGMMLKFETNELGDIQALSMQLEPEAEATRFSYQPEARLSAPETLKKYQGSYQLNGIKLTIQAQHDHLILRVPGQPDYELQAYRPDIYQFKLVKGYLVRFELNQGKVQAMYLIQPDGVYKTTRLPD